MRRGRSKAAIAKPKPETVRPQPSAPGKSSHVRSPRPLRQPVEGTMVGKGQVRLADAPIADACRSAPERGDTAVSVPPTIGLIKD